jgi:Cd2+/Zn2+-exporting ATPase
MGEPTSDQAPRALGLEDFEAPLTRAERRAIAGQLGPLLVGAGILALAFVYGRVFPGQAQLAEALKAFAAILVSIPILRRGLAGFLSRQANDLTEQLVSLAILAAMATGDFVTATLVPLFLELGHLFEERSSRGARAAIDGIRKLSAQRANRWVEGEEQEVDPGELAEGDQVVVRPGQVIPVDGEVALGHSSVDQAPITGESVYEDVGPGDRVYSGTINLGGLLRVRATQVGQASVIGRVLEVLRKVEASKLPVLRLLERYAGVYLPVVLSIAGVTLFLTGELDRAVAVLIVSCPCALVLAGPAAMVVAMTASTRKSVLIKSASFLETVAEVDTLVLDKTGTVTMGALSLDRVHPVGDASEEDVLAAAARCGHGSIHPVSKAVVSAARLRGIAYEEPESCVEIPGKGVEVEDRSGALRLGRPVWLGECGVESAFEVPVSGPGVWVARGDVVLGYLSLIDRPRQEAAAALKRTRALGIDRLVLLTGDREEVAQEVGAELGFDAYVAEVLPEEKLDVVREEQAAGRKVMMVGDGVNDALALSGADVGVAIGARINEVALGGADVALMSGDLQRLPLMMQLAERTRSTVVQNAVIGTLFSVGMVALASAGVITALVGAILHNAGAVFVIANSSRLLPSLDEELEETPQDAPELRPQPA